MKHIRLFEEYSEHEYLFGSCGVFAVNEMEFTNHIKERISLRLNDLIVENNGHGPFYPTFSVPTGAKGGGRMYGNCFIVMCHSNRAITMVLVPRRTSAHAKIERFKYHTASKENLSLRAMEKLRVEHRYIQNNVNLINMTPVPDLVHKRRN